MAQLDDLHLSPRTQRVAGKSEVLQVILRAPHACHAFGCHSPIHTKKQTQSFNKTWKIYDINYQSCMCKHFGQEITDAGQSLYLMCPVNANGFFY